MPRHQSHPLPHSITSTGTPVEAIDRGHNQMGRLLDTHILDPAGMRRTMASQWHRETIDVFFDMAQGYGVTAEGGLIPRAPPERHLAGGAEIVSTVEDLARVDIALDTGALGGPELMGKVFTPATAPGGSLLPYAYGWYVQEYRGERLVWHSGWDEEAGFSAQYLKVPARDLTLILLANGEGLRWGNPLDEAAVEGSPFARVFLDQFVFGKEAALTDTLMRAILVHALISSPGTLENMLFLSRGFVPLIRLSIAVALMATPDRGNAQAIPSAATSGFRQSGILYDQLAQVDSILFDALFARCDAERANAFLAADVEFYDDRTGLSAGDDLREDFRRLTENCPADHGVRRILLPESVEVYPIEGFGAVQTGVHHFVERGASTSTVAKFIHVWKRVGDKWELARIISLHEIVDATRAAELRR